MFMSNLNVYVTKLILCINLNLLIYCIKICPHLINLLIFLADMGFSNDSEGLEKL